MPPPTGGRRQTADRSRGRARGRLQAGSKPVSGGDARARRSGAAREAGARADAAGACVQPIACRAWCRLSPVSDAMCLAQTSASIPVQYAPGSPSELKSDTASEMAAGENRVFSPSFLVTASSSAASIVSWVRLISARSRCRCETGGRSRALHGRNAKKQPSKVATDVDYTDRRAPSTDAHAFARVSHRHG